MAPNEACPECGAMGRREVYLEASSFRCPSCGYREPPRIRPRSASREAEAVEAYLNAGLSREDD